MKESLLEVNNLVTVFRTKKGNLAAVREVSFSVKKGQTLCIVGESGCGKSITALSVIGLLPSNGFIKSGEIKLNSKEIQSSSKDELQKLRGNRISMIFQEPMTALNPVLTIGYQLTEPLLIHRKLSKKQARNQAIKILEEVGIPYPEKRLKQYPHELSGGMRQRVMIAIALSCEPDLLIADEPTTALDVTIQAQILDLIKESKDKMDMGVMMITHDMGVVAEVADRVMVMYAGRKVEEAPVQEIFDNPKHPYTIGLLNSVPDIDNPDFELEAIPGSMPSLDEEISGCSFHPRCQFAMDKCKVTSPYEFEVSTEHTVSCWLQDGSEVNGSKNKSERTGIAK